MHNPLAGILALVAPERLSQSLAQADYQDELKRNTPLRDSSKDKRDQALNQIRQNTIDRLKIFRQNLLISFLSMLSAIAMGFIITRWINFSALKSIFGIASILCFSSATLGRLGWEGQTYKGNTSVERLDQTLFHILYWLGAFFGTVSVI